MGRLNRLSAACSRLGMSHPNQFAWWCGLETYGIRDLELGRLGYTGPRVQVRRHHDPRDSSVRAYFTITVRDEEAGRFKTLSEALEFLADRLDV